MPDGDKVYGQLSQAYEKPYEQLCESHHGPGEIAYNLLDALKRDLRKYGDPPCCVIFEVAEHLTQLLCGPLFEPLIDWSSLRREIDAAARQHGEHRRGVALAQEACQRYLCTLRYGEAGVDHRQALVEGYLMRVYEAQFEERVPTEDHYDGVDHATLMERMHELRPFVLESLRASFIPHILAHETVAGLRRPPRPGPTVTADTDLLG